MCDDILNRLAKILEQRKSADPASSYTASLYEKGLDSILKKIGEEAIEVVIAAKSTDNTSIIHEIADLWFHVMVLLSYRDLGPEDILKELHNRFDLSGLEEKANRNDQY